MRIRAIVGFAELFFPVALFAQTLTPAADVGIALWVPVVTGFVGVALGIVIEKYIVKNPSAPAAAQAELLALLHKLHEGVTALAAKIEHKPAPPGPG